MFELRAQIESSFAVRNRVFLPAALAQHPVSNSVARMIRFHYAADRAGHHHLADCHRGSIGRRITHASAHVGVERKIYGAKQYLSLGGNRHGHSLDAEVIGDRRSNGS